MHTDISIRNWFVKDNGALVLGDFGSAKVLGPFGYVKAGEPQYYDDKWVAPEMKCFDGFTAT